MLLRSRTDANTNPGARPARGRDMARRQDVLLCVNRPSLPGLIAGNTFSGSSSFGHRVERSRRPFPMQSAAASLGPAPETGALA